MVYKNPKFDLNKNPADFWCDNEFNKNNRFDDTTLRLECFGHDTISQQDTKSAPNEGCRLVLGLGPTPSVCSNDRDLVLKLSLSNHSATSKSDLNPFSNFHSASVEVSNGCGFHHVVDEGSTTAKSSGGYMPSLLLAPRISVPLQKLKIPKPEPLVVSDFSTETASDQQKNSKKCEFSTSKAARVKSALCVKQGGGKRCVVEGWTRSAERQVGLCISHDGERRCCFHGCKKEAQRSTMFCKVHGSSNKGSEGSAWFCKAHSGGKKCLYNGGGFCPKSIHDGTNFCMAHDVGKSRVVPGCTNSAQDSTNFCKAQGGMKWRICGRKGKYDEFAKGRGCLCAGSPDSHSLSCSSTVSNSTSWLGKPAKRRQLIPPQVLVPSSLKSSSFLPFTKQSSSTIDNSGGRKTLGLVVPEGRVHGGRLLSLVSGNSRDAVIDRI